MTLENSRTRVFAVVTVFRAPDDLVDRVSTLSQQVECVIVVDDGSHSLDGLRFTDPGVITVDLPENVGIAAALNRGIERARDLGATHIVTMDQDSTLPHGYVAEALRYLDRLQSAGFHPAAVVPARFGDFVVATTGTPEHPRDPIQSGQVIPADVFQKIGDFDERLFIDGVDTEFTLRARAAGLEFWILPNSALEHSLGEQVPIMVFGKHLSVLGRKRHHYYHAPFRTYYAMRNGLALWSLHRRHNTSWLVRRTLGLFWATFLAVSLSSDRRAQFVAAVHGFAHGVRMRLGRIPDRTLRMIDARRRS